MGHVEAVHEAVYEEHMRASTTKFNVLPAMLLAIDAGVKVRGSNLTDEGTLNIYIQDNNVVSL